MQFRIIKKGKKYYPQFKKRIVWQTIEHEGKMWDNMFGNYTFDNAHQRLYIFMSRLSKSACSIFEIDGVNKSKHFQYVDFSWDKNKIKRLYNKYKGKTEFMKTIFPEFFGGEENKKLTTVKAALHYDKVTGGCR
jgi:hypothetical protein